MSPMNNRLMRPRASGGFSPNSISGLSIWLDATRITSSDAPSGQVATWSSRVGSTSFSQTTANNRPTLFESSGDVQGATPAAINGLQAVYLDGTNDRMSTADSFSDTQWTCFAACRPATVSGGRGLLTRDNQGVARGPQNLRTSGSSIIAIGFNSSGGAYQASRGTISANATIVAHSVQTASQLTVFLNNVAGTPLSGVQRADANTSFSVGVATTEPGASDFFLGLIGEILYYNRALTTDEQKTIYEYLGKRWGVI